MFRIVVRNIWSYMFKVIIIFLFYVGKNINFNKDKIFLGSWVVRVKIIRKKYINSMIEERELLIFNY